MNSVVYALLRLAPERDSELIASYHRYSEALSHILSPEQYQEYANMLQRQGALRTIEELSSDDLADLSSQEQSVLAAIRADQGASEEYRQVAMLLRQRGHQTIVSDFNTLEVGN